MSTQAPQPAPIFAPLTDAPMWRIIDHDRPLIDLDRAEWAEVPAYVAADAMKADA